MVSIFRKYCRVLVPGEIIDLCWLRRLIEEIGSAKVAPWLSQQT